MSIVAPARVNLICLFDSDLGAETNLITDIGYTALFEANPYLEQFYTVKNAGDISTYPGEGTVRALADNCPRIQLLTLYGNTAPMSALVYLMKNLPDLTSLTLNKFTQATGTAELMNTLLNTSHLQHIRYLNGPFVQPNSQRALTDQQIVEVRAARPYMFFAMYSESPGPTAVSDYYGTPYTTSARCVSEDSFYGKRLDCIRTSSDVNVGAEQVV